MTHASARTTKLLWVFTVVVSLFAVSSCEKPVTLASRASRLRPGRPLRIVSNELLIRGPQSELCVRIYPNYGFSRDGWALIRATGERVVVRAALVGSTGAAIDLGNPGYRVSGDEKQLCFTMHSDSLGGRYEALDLRADDTVTVGPITWWSGTRRAAL